jgi:hypothetical protein
MILRVLDELIYDLWSMRLQVKVRERHCLGEIAEVAVLLDTVLGVWLALALFLAIELLIYSVSYLHGVVGEPAGPPDVTFAWGLLPVIGKRMESVPLFALAGAALGVVHALIRLRLGALPRQYARGLRAGGPIALEIAGSWRRPCARRPRCRRCARCRRRARSLGASARSLARLTRKPPPPLPPPWLPSRLQAAVPARGAAA